MKINLDALKALELKLAEYSKENGTIAEHESANTNCSKGCIGQCYGDCSGTCNMSCVGSCYARGK